jgi:phytoene desaturase
MTSRKVTVIGAGLSGLAAGIHLLRQGFRVTLLEANDVIGGCCSTSSVDGYTFNNGAMYVAVPRLIDRAFARLGLDRQDLLPLRRITVPQASVLPGGTRVTLVDHGRASIEGDNAAARTATLQVELERCADKWAPVLRLFADDLMPYPLSLSRVISKAWRHLPKLAGNLAAELNRSFSDPEARAAVSAVTLYTGLPPERTPVFQIMGLVAMLDDGFYLPEGGMNAISRVLRDAFLDLGGELHTGTRVKRILIGSGKVRALLLEDNAEVSAGIVVSTATAMATFACLMAPTDVPASMRRRIKRAPLSHRALGIQLGLTNRIEVPAYAVNHVPLMEQQYQALAPQPQGIRWLSYAVPTLTLPELSPAGGSVIEMFTSVDQNLSLDAWDDQSADALADEVIAALGRHHPLDIRARRVLSPRTYAERMNLFGGALYGLSPGASPMQQFPHKTPIQGLFLAGQTTYPGYGTGPALFTGILAAEAIAESLLRA